MLVNDDSDRGIDDVTCTSSVEDDIDKDVDEEREGEREVVVVKEDEEEEEDNKLNEDRLFFLLHPPPSLREENFEGKEKCVGAGTWNPLVSTKIVIK
jgi:hypothetical protein